MDLSNLDELLNLDYSDIDAQLDEGLEELDDILDEKLNLEELNKTIDAIMNPTEEEKEKTKNIVNSFIGK